MVILIRIKSAKTILIFFSILMVCFLCVYLWHQSTKNTSVFMDKEITNMLTEEIQLIFNLRNKALLEQDETILANLYNKDIRTGLWAYEHELKKMKYLHQWDSKQAVKFNKIDSHIIVRSIKEKGDGFALNLLVSTAYEYVYEDTPETSNNFRNGTYYSIDLMPNGDGWFITREWYTDPFADSLHVDDLKVEELQELILSGKPKDLSELNQRRIDALAYIDQYCGAASLPEYGFKYNPKYRDYNPEGGDCANFASQMLYEGGKFKKNKTWNYERGAGSRTWLNANAFNSYMIDSGRASVITHGSYESVLKSSYKLLPGDYIAYEKKGKVTHISIVSGEDSKGYILVNSHNSDRYRVPWDMGWNNKGIKFWLVRVHY